jgi:TolA-binding protein
MEKEMNNIEMFEQDAGALVVKNEDLQSVGELAKRAKQLEKEIEELEDSVKERKEQQRKLLEESIPGRSVRAGHEVIQNV